MIGQRIGMAGGILLAVCFLFYGTAVYRTGSGSRFWLVWLFLAGISLLAAVFARFGIWTVMPPLLKRAVLTAAVLAAALVAATWGCVLSSFSSSGEDDLDVLIVLGAQVRESGPSVVLRYRLDTAAGYLRENPDTLCIVSGGKGANEPEPEGTAMKRYLVSRGIAGSRIRTEIRSKNTIQNIRFSGRMIDREREHVGIVTSDFHVFRGVHLAQRNGYRHVCGIAAPSRRFYLLNNMLRESGGILKDFFCGHL